MAKSNPPSSPLSALQRHSRIATLTFLAVVVGAPALSLALVARQYEASARISVGEKDVGISSLGQALTDFYNQAPGKTADPVATQAERLKSSQVIERAIKSVQRKRGLSADQVPTVKQVREAMKISIVPATNILQVSLRGTEPDTTTELLNALIRAAVRDNEESTRKEAGTLRKFLEDKLPEQVQRLQRTANAETQYREQNGIVSIENQAMALVTSIAALEDEERKLRALVKENTIKDTMLRQVTGLVSPESAYTSVRVGQNEALKELQKQVSAMDVAIADARSRLGDEHPDLLALLQKRDDLQVLLEKQLDQVLPGNQNPANIAAEPVSQDLASRMINSQVEQEAAQGRLGIVQSEIVRLKAIARQLPQFQKNLAALMLERQAAEESLKLLNSKLEEARIAENQILSTMRIVELANVPTDAVSPKPLALIAISAIAGLLLAGALVALLELMDTSLRNAAEAEAVLSLPVLGNLPKLSACPPSADSLQHFLDSSEQVEPYRLFLKNLESSSDRKRKVVVISSVNASEGKSATVLYLAAVAAMHSRRTLIIDTDLRHPLQHRLLDVTAYPGLTEVVGDHLPCWNAIRPTSIPNLSILPFGRSVPRASALIESSAMTRLIEEVSAHYDLVLIDAAPISLYADAASLSQASDGMVVVIQPNVTQREKASRAIAELRKAGQVPLGLVMNETVLAFETEPPVMLPPVPPKASPVFS